MKKWLAAVAAAVLVAAPVYAHGDKKHGEYQHQKSSQAGTGGAATAGATEAIGEKELSGKVLKVSGNNVFMEHMGASVPVEIRKDTKFEGVAAKKDLKEGQQISVSFTVRNQVKNVATRINVSEAGTGASGQSEGSEQLDMGSEGSEQQPETQQQSPEPAPSY